MSSAAINTQEISNPLKPIEEDDDTVEAELMRLQGLPRFLFTIKEETREELESEDGRSRMGSRGRSLSDLFVASSTPFLTPLASPPFFAPPLTPMFEYSCEEEFIKTWSSPPPQFKFLRDAEEKLQRKKLMEDAKTVAKEDDADAAFFSVKIGKSRDRGQHQQLSSSQVIPLTSSPSSFRRVH